MSPTAGKKGNFRLARKAGWLALLVMLAMAAAMAYMAWMPKGPEPDAPVAGTPASVTGLLARGAYLARAADCIACHTIPGGEEFAGGLAFTLPFGVIRSSNITPDRLTGIGAWSDDEFVKAVRQGVAPRGHLYPAMPYTSYTGMSRNDVLAIKAYLFSLKPVSAPAAPLELSFPFNQRWGLALWNMAFFQDHRFEPAPEKGLTWNRGAYLATALGHCSECHTPRNIGFGLKLKQGLAGAPVQGWMAYNSSSDMRYGVGAWSEQQLTDFLSKGHAEGRSSAVGPMAEVVEHSLQYLAPVDIASLVVYLRATPAQAGQPGTEVALQPAPAAASTAVIPASSVAPDGEHGKRLFAATCAGCHQWNGAGRQSDYAALAGSRTVNDPHGHSLVQVILSGSGLAIGGQSQRMPSFGTLGDADIAALANYTIRQFGARQGEVSARQVAAQRHP
ncbi:c-type cytochrome [Janthinobacterium sp.]|uniref:c-type cytochrome n=1 Tax=Janthinobacterium sp. TaxID=1871054 RepID=UPI0028A07F24|nr:c-type cytochrome [Janthinobacterium sp.]